jgi:hypothetical protein
VAIESTAAMAIAGTTFGQDAFSNAERPVRRLRVVKAATGQ